MQNTFPQFDTVSAKDLLTQSVEPLGFTIDSILPHGLFILAGSSKIGKSWLALDMSICVISGDTFWNYHTSQGDVLYLALEDTNKRLQERLNRITTVCDVDAQADIHFVTKAQKLGNGLAEQIAAFLDSHPQTKLIVIDTLQYIRNTGKYIGTYSGDYHDMDALREIIAGHDLTMLLITHNHKSKDADPVNRVYGSAGLTGAVDGIFVLEKKKRVGNKARLTIANRDTESFQFDLRFDIQSCRWLLIGETGADDDDEEEQLYELFNLLMDSAPVWKGTATQLCSALIILDRVILGIPDSLVKDAEKPSRVFEQTSRYRILYLSNEKRSPD